MCVCVGGGGVQFASQALTQAGWCELVAAQRRPASLLAQVVDLFDILRGRGDHLAQHGMC